MGGNDLLREMLERDDMFYLFPKNQQQIESNTNHILKPLQKENEKEFLNMLERKFIGLKTLVVLKTHYDWNKIQEYCLETNKNASTLFCLATAYEKGVFGEIDYDNAKKYFKMSSDRGHPISKLMDEYVYTIPTPENARSHYDKLYESTYSFSSSSSFIFIQKAMDYLVVYHSKFNPEMVTDIISSLHGQFHSCVSEAHRKLSYELRNENSSLKQEVNELKKGICDLMKEVENLKAEISYMPYGKGYLEAKDDFEELNQ